MDRNSFIETMHSQSSEKLKEIVEKKRGDYQPDAIAAAEAILKKRNVKFKQPEPDEHVEMTYEEIREDIRKRRVKGQSMTSIRAYYKECGVDIDMPEIKGEEQQNTAPASPGFTMLKARGIGALIGIGLACFVQLQHADKGTVKVVTWGIAIIGVGWLLLSLRKKK